MQTTIWMDWENTRQNNASKWKRSTSRMLFNLFSLLNKCTLFCVVLCARFQFCLQFIIMVFHWTGECVVCQRQFRKYIPIECKNYDEFSSFCKSNAECLIYSNGRSRSTFCVREESQYGVYLKADRLNTEKEQNKQRCWFYLFKLGANKLQMCVYLNEIVEVMKCKLHRGISNIVIAP